MNRKLYQGRREGKTVSKIAAQKGQRTTLDIPVEFWLGSRPETINPSP